MTLSVLFQGTEWVKATETDMGSEEELGTLGAEALLRHLLEREGEERGDSRKGKLGRCVLRRAAPHSRDSAGHRGDEVLGVPWPRGRQGVWRRRGGLARARCRDGGPPAREKQHSLPQMWGGGVSPSHRWVARTLQVPSESSWPPIPPHSRGIPASRSGAPPAYSSLPAGRPPTSAGRKAQSHGVGARPRTSWLRSADLTSVSLSPADPGLRWGVGVLQLGMSPPTTSLGPWWGSECCVPQNSYVEQPIP